MNSLVAAAKKHGTHGVIFIDGGLWMQKEIMRYIEIAKEMAADPQTVQILTTLLTEIEKLSTGEV